MTTDKHLGDTLSHWLEETAPTRLPDRVLEATFELTRRRRQDRGWRTRLTGRRISRPALALGGSTAIVIALALATMLPFAGVLPTTPADWSRIVIDDQTDGVVDAIVGSRLGVLAVTREGTETRLYYSPDGTTWTRVMADDPPAVGTDRAVLVASEERFLLVGRDVLASDDGLTWRRVGGAEEDADLRVGTPIAAAAVGPGYVAVGSDNMAWYSTDGSDWMVAEVPPATGAPTTLDLPLDPGASQGAVEMQGIAEAGDHLIAWGISIWFLADGSRTYVPVLWTSNDGMSWEAVASPPWAFPKVGSRPNGFVAASEDGTVWSSSDGRSWVATATDAFGSTRWPTGPDGWPENDEGVRVEMVVLGLAAGPAGYVAAGIDGMCLFACPSQEAVIWTSADGAAWVRLPRDDRFGAAPAADRSARTEASYVVAWGSRFVVGGSYQGDPTVWISK